MDTARMGFWSSMDVNNDLFCFLYGKLVDILRKQEINYCSICHSIDFKHRVESNLFSISQCNLWTSRYYNTYAFDWIPSLSVLFHFKIEIPIHPTLFYLARNCHVIKRIYFIQKLEQS